MKSISTLNLLVSVGTLIFYFSVVNLAVIIAAQLKWRKVSLVIAGAVFILFMYAVYSLFINCMLYYSDFWKGVYLLAVCGLSSKIRTSYITPRQLKGGRS